VLHSQCLSFCLWGSPEVSSFCFWDIFPLQRPLVQDPPAPRSLLSWSLFRTFRGQQSPFSLAAEVLTILQSLVGGASPSPLQVSSMDENAYNSQQEAITLKAKERNIALEELNAVFDQKFDSIVQDYPGTRPAWRLGRAEYL
jgi:hypothetical protein